MRWFWHYFEAEVCKQRYQFTLRFHNVALVAQNNKITKISSCHFNQYVIKTILQRDGYKAIKRMTSHELHGVLNHRLVQQVNQGNGEGYIKTPHYRFRCEGNPSVADGFPSQRASNAETISEHEQAVVLPDWSPTLRISQEVQRWLTHSFREHFSIFSSAEMGTCEKILIQN